jgi:glycerol-3-phosphate acyltransferase PlsY
VTPTAGTLALAALLGYALGAVPTGVLATRLFHAPDVRRVGSGHTGGTNVARATGKAWLGALTGVVDAALAAGAVALARALWPASPWPAAAAGAAAVWGHNWSVYIGLRGGVGLSSIAGMLLALAPLPTLGALFAAILVWAGARRLLGHDARSTAATMAVAPLLLALFGQPPAGMAAGTLAALAVIGKALQDWRRTYRPGEDFARQFLGREERSGPKRRGG